MSDVTKHAAARQPSLHRQDADATNVVARGLPGDSEENACTPPLPENITVAVRAADIETALSLQRYQTIEEGYRFDGVVGRYVEIRARFKGTCPGADFVTPAICNLIVSHGIGDMN
ncbi:MAG: hypothetical protein ABIG44_04120, partial [Planctomycetota bacterium]